MPRYVVGVDRLWEVSADGPGEAERTLARLIEEGNIKVEGDDCITYEQCPEDGHP